MTDSPESMVSGSGAGPVILGMNSGRPGASSSIATSSRSGNGNSNRDMIAAVIAESASGKALGRLRTSSMPSGAGAGSGLIEDQYDPDCDEVAGSLSSFTLAKRSSAGARLPGSSKGSVVTAGRPTGVGIAAMPSTSSTATGSGYLGPSGASGV